MRRSLAAGLCLALLWAVPCGAQTPASQPTPSAPIVNLGYGGMNFGTAVVEKFGAAVGGEAGVRVWKNLDLVVEIAWIENAVTRRELDRAATLANHLTTTQGAEATGTVKVPALYAGVGVRWVFEQSGRFRPYILATFGGAGTDRQPTFTLGGADITGSLPQFGVTLGQDLIGKERHAATTGGIGILIPYKSFYVDAGARLVSMGSSDQRVNASRLVFGGGYRF